MAAAYYVLTQLDGPSTGSGPDWDPDGQDILIGAVAGLVLVLLVVYFAKVFLP